MLAQAQTAVMAKTECLNLSIVNPISSATMAQIQIDSTETLAELKYAVMTATKNFQTVSLILGEHTLEPDELPLSDFRSSGLEDGAEVGIVRCGGLNLPGWVRLCHASGEKAIIWDWPMHMVQRFAEDATIVRIQQKGDENKHKYVVSKPGSYPVANIRSGNPIGYGRALSRKQVDSYWEAPECPELLNCLWHTSAHWHRRSCQSLVNKIYHCCDNAGGIHWAVDAYGDDNGSIYGWSFGSKDELELYVDVPERLLSESLSL